jgi:hypothetical membrane protein
MSAKKLALAGILGPVLFTALVIAQGFLLPDYSHVRLPISALATWPTGWIQILNFYVFGVLTIAFAVALHRGAQPTPHGVVGVALLAISGIGIVLSGVFSWTMVDGVPTETPPHAVAAIMTFGGTALGLMVLSRRLRDDPRWRDLAMYTMCSGSIVGLLFIAVGLFAIDNAAAMHPWVGLIQRVVCAVWFACMIVLANRLRRIST